MLAELSVCGTVLQHIIHPNSNWMHVRMQTRSVQSQPSFKHFIICLLPVLMDHLQRQY